ncbi:phospholipid/cholesterol/gamma-HCH transport system substrate-binding protein [Amycolatopsis arida]|uniref:Phospholipid/cholesterol/gamma-HCH transport system substrate-binding protein n=1 Tax=Amycolatopsis arida TaxID=587909 RepID=A0A1I5QZG7_9PSEU|nr:MlaD family protein [Amycolatopsis arida]TDX99019.1 phospholipid/cholesterol/gamma-HCH transport system substrate-binding protein [Amycolatopsis arida]SFP51694.1 phospholipid/cholesterol/gamma-HCH transport system substrate-binding protein [Amycolatopsis arida]
MLTRRIRIQIGIFVLVALTGVSYVAAEYVGLHRVVGGGGYVVRAQFTESGGIFTGAEVTYRGVAVGRVGPLRLIPDGVEVDLSIDAEAPPIPADVDAAVANRSAVGEQYVDLRPRTDGGPVLAEGSVIPRARTDTPPRVDTVLSSLDSLVASVPERALTTVVDELYDASVGAGENLGVLLDATGSFTAAAIDHLPQSTALVTDAGTVLDTQRRQSAAITSFGEHAKLLADQLRRSDGDLRALLPAVPAAAEQVRAMVAESGPALGVLMANLLTVSDVFAVRRDGLEQLLVTGPEVVQAGSSIVRDDVAHLGLSLTFFDPLPCTEGYDTTYRRGLDVSVPPPLNTAARCTLPPGSATGVRGSQNAPGPR